MHRDLSDGNIIMWQPMMAARGVDMYYNLVSRTTGKLIDLDYAKRTENKKTVERLVPGLSSDIVQLHTHILRIHNTQITEGAVAQTLKFTDLKSINYCYEAIQFDVMKSKSDEGDWTAEDLGWWYEKTSSKYSSTNHMQGPQPDFDSHFPENSLFFMAKTRFLHPRGTIPFISYQLMARKPDTSNNAIHDMESLFWVLIHICLIRESGGRHRWKDPPEEPKASGTGTPQAVEPEDPKTPKPETPEERKRREERERKTLIEVLFYSDLKDISSEKAIYFHPDSDDEFEHLLNHIHDYFDPLKDLLRRWRSVLVLGYTFKAYEYYLVHDYIRKIIGDALELPAVQNEDKDTPVIQQELSCRAKYGEFVCTNPGTRGDNTFPSRDASPSAPLPTLPSLPSQTQGPQSASFVSQPVLNHVPAPSSNVAVTPATNSNHCYPSIPNTPVHTPNCLPISFTPSTLLLNRPLDVVLASVTTTPNPGRAPNF